MDKEESIPPVCLPVYKCTGRFPGAIEIFKDGLESSLQLCGFLQMNKSKISYTK